MPPPPTPVMLYDHAVVAWRMLSIVPWGVRLVQKPAVPVPIVIATPALVAVAALVRVRLVPGVPVTLAMVSSAGMPVPVIAWPTSAWVTVPAVIVTVVVEFVLPVMTFDPPLYKLLNATRFG